MKKSSKVGVTLALGLTMSSSFMVRDNDNSTGWPFGLQTAQASVSHFASSPYLFNDRTITERESAPLLRRRKALADRIRKELLQGAPVPVTRIQ